MSSSFGRLQDQLDLVRAPAALSVLGDTVAGAAAAGHRFGIRQLPLSAASACLYAAGMALNDYADRELDAVERPERPIPSGRVTARGALATASVLTVTGIGLAALAGRRHLLPALALTASIWTYDLIAKPTKLGPLSMSACRGLDVLMGAGTGHLAAALPAAAVVAGHTVAVTALSRGEVSGTTPGVAAAAGATSAVGAMAAVAGSGSGSAALASGGAALKYLAGVLPAQLRAVDRPGADEARTATRNGIRAMIPLQTALTARAGALPAAAALLVLDLGGTQLLRRRRKADIT